MGLSEASLAGSQTSTASLRLAERLAESAAESSRPILRATEVREGTWGRERRRPSRPAWRAILRGIDPQLTSVELEVIERRYRLLGFFVRRELHERESSRATGFPIRSDVNADHLSGGRERLTETILRRVEAQVANKNFPWNGRILPIE